MSCNRLYLYVKFWMKTYDVERFYDSTLRVKSLFKLKDPNPALHIAFRKAFAVVDKRTLVKLHAILKSLLKDIMT